MFRRPTSVALALVVVAIILGVLWSSDQLGNSQETTAIDSRPDIITEQTTTVTQEPPRSNSTTSPNIEGRVFNSEITLALGGGHRDGACEWVTSYISDRATGEQIAAKKQVCEMEKPRHPYDDYTSDTLEGMAYSDPFAAIVLGKRLREDDPKEAWSLMLRGAALLQDGRPLVWLATMSYSKTSTDGVADVRSIEHNYVLMSIADRLSETNMYPGNRYRAAEVHTLTDADIERLDEAVRNQLRRLEIIQSEILGSSQ